MKDLSIDAPGLDGHSLPDLEWVGGYVHINDTVDLTDLTILPSLRSVGKELEIRNNEALAALDGLQSLEHVGGTLEIEDNAALVEIDALSNLTQVGGIEIVLNPVLESVEGLSGLSGQITGDASIGGHPALAGLHGLEGVTSVDGMLRFANNESLVDLTGLDSLESVTGDLWINMGWEDGYPWKTPSDALTSFEGLESLEEVGGRLGMSIGDYMTDLTPLSGLSSVGGLQIYDGGGVSSLAPFAGLSGDVSSLSLYQMPNVETLVGLEGISGVGYLTLFQMAGISGFDGLDGVTSVDEIFFNEVTNLMGCDICDFMDGLSASPSDIFVQSCGDDECLDWSTLTCP